MGGQNQDYLKWNEVVRAMKDESRKRKLNNCNRAYNANMARGHWYTFEGAKPESLRLRFNFRLEMAKAGSSNAGQATAPEADAANSESYDPEDNWIWNEDEKNYFRFDSTVLDIVWREGRQAASLEADIEKWDIDDPHGYWM
jgi:hypothetical protein